MSDISILEKIKQAEIDSEKEIKDAEEEARAKLIEAHAKAENDLKAGIERADLAYQKEIAAAEADASKRHSGRHAVRARHDQPSALLGEERGGLNAIEQSETCCR